MSLTTIAPPATARVLIADDSVVCRGVLVILLETAGYDVISVFDGREALQALRTHAFDLAILDNEMPNLGGLGALAELRGFLPALPVLVCSGTVTPDQAVRYHELGIEELLAKPVDPRALREKISLILARRQSAAAGQPAVPSVRGMPSAHAPSPLVAGPSRYAAKLQAELLRLRDFRSVAILEGCAGSGRFELALTLGPASVAHRFVCHADELSPAHLELLCQPAAASTGPVILVVLEAQRLDSARQSFLEDLLLGRVAAQTGLSKRLRLVLGAQTSLCDLHFNEFLLMRAVTATLRLPDFTDRWMDWAEIARAVLRRAGTGRGTFDPEAVRWIDRHTWTGDYMQLHRTIELARRRAGVTSMITVEHLAHAVAAERTCNDPLFHDLLFHVHSGSDD